MNECIVVSWADLYHFNLLRRFADGDFRIVDRSAMLEDGNSLPNIDQIIVADYGNICVSRNSLCISGTLIEIDMIA